MRYKFTREELRWECKHAVLLSCYRGPSWCYGKMALLTLEQLLQLNTPSVCPLTLAAAAECELLLGTMGVSRVLYLRPQQL